MLLQRKKVSKMMYLESLIFWMNLDNLESVISAQEKKMSTKVNFNLHKNKKNSYKKS